MLYHVYELNHAAMAPWRAAAIATRKALKHPLNPWSYTSAGRTMSAAAKLFETTTRRYGKPEFGIEAVEIGADLVPVSEHCVWEDTFCSLLHFEKQWPAKAKPQPRLLIVAPMSGHYATLLRGTVQDMLPDHDVYITDWQDARMVPIHKGQFDLNDYIDYLIRMFEHLGEPVHVMGVCQPGPAVLAATALMAEDGNASTPASMILMGSPIDTRESPTTPNLLAQEWPLSTFKEKVVSAVPWPHPGFGRRVYPGFVQLSSFMAMNREAHTRAHWDYYGHLVDGDGDSAEKHRVFYDEYMAVMDLTEEFYIQTVDEIFQRHLLPKGEFRHRGHLVDPRAISQTGLLTVEGEHDDISGIGQTQAAHGLCASLPAALKQDYVQPDVGHYGVFNGRRFRSEIRPRVTKFIQKMDRRKGK